MCWRLLLGYVQGQSSSGCQDCLLGDIDAFSHGGCSLVFGFIPYFTLSSGGGCSCSGNDLRRLLSIKTSAYEVSVLYFMAVGSARRCRRNLSNRTITQSRSHSQVGSIFVNLCNRLFRLDRITNLDNPLNTSVRKKKQRFFKTLLFAI